MKYLHDIELIYFWQCMVTPHMVYLAEALAASGKQVIYVANESMSTDRQQMGWSAPALDHAELRIATDAATVAETASTAPPNSIHLCQGLRRNGLVSIAQKVLAVRGVPYWVVMETVDDAGAQGLLKRRLYRWLLSRKHPTLQGILAIGWATENWLIARGANRNTTFPFAYFLSESAAQIACKRCFAPHFRFLFVGQLIKRKRVDRLLDALAAHLSFDFELVIIGDGPARRTLVELGNQLLPNRVRWLGHLPMADIPQEMVNADCLILPSRHDGWGAVASEALIVGTPVICSDACGAAGVVRASGVGGVFPRDKVMTLSSLLGEMLRNGPLEDSERYELKEWAKCIGAEAGAKYLLEILRCTEEYGERPEAPWSRECSENRARSLSND